MNKKRFKKLSPRERQFLKDNCDSDIIRVEFDSTELNLVPGKSTTYASYFSSWDEEPIVIVTVKHDNGISSFNVWDANKYFDNAKELQSEVWLKIDQAARKIEENK